MADYDLNEIADALASAVQGLDTNVIDGQQQDITGTGVALGVANAPAVVFELDSVDWDVSMARGADSFVFLAYLLVSSADSPTGQRLVRQLLSTGGTAGRLKDALEAAAKDGQLATLVSYINVGRTRTIGNINYAGADYLGAVLEIEVMAQ